MLVTDFAPVMRGDVVRTAPRVEEVGVERMEMEVNCGLRVGFDFPAGWFERAL